jgi:hypothetical protein
MSDASFVWTVDSIVWMSLRTTSSICTGNAALLMKHQNSKSLHLFSGSIVTAACLKTSIHELVQKNWNELMDKGGTCCCY